MSSFMGISSKVKCILLLSFLGAVALASGKTFHKSSKQYSWADCQKYCEKRNDELATALTSKEFSELAQFVVQKGINAWIGLRLAEYDGDFRWVGGSQLAYEEWDVNCPRLVVSQQCVVLPYSSGKLVNLPCSYPHGCLCERKDWLDAFERISEDIHPGSASLLVLHTRSTVECSTQCLRTDRCHLFMLKQLTCTLYSTTGLSFQPCEYPSCSTYRQKYNY